MDQVVLLLVPTPIFDNAWVDSTHLLKATASSHVVGSIIVKS